MRDKKNLVVLLVVAVLFGAGISITVATMAFGSKEPSPPGAARTSSYSEPSPRPSTPMLWQVSINARASQSGATAYAGVAEDASEHLDRYDAPLPPPPPGNFVQLYFPDPDLAEKFGNASRDVRPPGGNTTWDFRVQASAIETVTLAWEVSKVPASYTSVQLLDGDARVLVDNMRTTASYVYSPDARGEVAPFKFRVF